MADLMIDNDDFQEIRSINRLSTICVCAMVIVSAFPIAQITIGSVFLYECPLGPFIPVYVLVSGAVTLVLVMPCGLPWVQEPDRFDQSCLVGFWKCLISALALFLVFWFVSGSYQIYSIHPPNYDKNLTTPKYNLTQSKDSHILSNLTNKLNLGVERENETLSNLTHRGQNWTVNLNQTGTNLNQTLSLTNMNNKTLTSEGRDRAQPNQTASVLPYCDRTLYLFAFWTTTLVYVFLGIALGTLCCLYTCVVWRWLTLSSHTCLGSS